MQDKAQGYSVEKANETAIPAQQPPSWQIFGQVVQRQVVSWTHVPHRYQGPLFCLQGTSAEVSQNTDYSSEEELGKTTNVNQKNKPTTLAQ